MKRTRHVCHAETAVPTTRLGDDEQPGRTIGAAFEELRRLCRAEGYHFQTVTRTARDFRDCGVALLDPFA